MRTRLRKVWGKNKKVEFLPDQDCEAHYAPAQEITNRFHRILEKVPCFLKITDFNSLNNDSTILVWPQNTTLFSLFSWAQLLTISYLSSPQGWTTGLQHAFSYFRVFTEHMLSVCLSGSFQLEYPVETQLGNEFTKCHTATERPLTTISWGVFCRVTLGNARNRNPSDCWLRGEGQ